MVRITPELLESYLKNELDPQTTEYVDRWLLENKIERDMLPNMLHPPESVRIMASLDPKKEWLRINRGVPPRRMAILSSVLKLAAMLVFALLAGYLWFQRDHLFTNDRLVTIANKESGVKVISLDDGSQLHLNRGAAVTFPEAFKTNRQIELSGEVFFDVAADPQHPFRIETADCQVQVKGTSFNVYADSSTVEVAVSSGVVQFTTPGDQQLTLERDEMASYARHERALTKSRTDHFNVFSWRTHLLVFQTTPLDEVVHDISRYFQRNIRIRSKPDTPLPEFTSRFENPSLTEVLDEMKAVLQITYTMDGNVVIIGLKENAKH